MKIRRGLIQGIQKKPISAVHIVLIGTKPDIIKQAPLILALRQRKHFTIIVHSGQHQQFNLSGGLEEEFGLTPDINLEVSGNLFEQQSQIIDRFGRLLKNMKSFRKPLIPYICADTTTAVAAGIASFANMISTVHVEAGLRTMSPPKKTILALLDESRNLKVYFKKLRDPNAWEKGSYEPYPEQFDTRAAAPSVGVHFAPTTLNRKHLMQEGYADNRIYTVGNTISDALEFIKPRTKTSTLLKRFPEFEKGELIRFCIHRRENITSRQRFLAIYEAMVQLVKEGRRVVLVSLGATEKALQWYGLKIKTGELAKTNPNFIYTPVLPYYTDTIALMQRCALVVTDSGSIQEETNMLGIPGVVLRFNTDRPEAIFAGSNVLAPPITKEVILSIIHGILDDQNQQNEMKRARKLYGKNVSKTMVRIIEQAVEKNSSFNLFEFLEHQRLGLQTKPFWRSGGAQW